MHIICWLRAPSALRRRRLRSQLVVRSEGGRHAFESTVLSDLLSGAAGRALGGSPPGVQLSTPPRVGNICVHSQHEFRERGMTG